MIFFCDSCNVFHELKRIGFSLMSISVEQTNVPNGTVAYGASTPLTNGVPVIRYSHTVQAEDSITFMGNFTEFRVKNSNGLLPLIGLENATILFGKDNQMMIQLENKEFPPEILSMVEKSPDIEWIKQETRVDGSKEEPMPEPEPQPTEIPFTGDVVGQYGNLTILRQKGLHYAMDEYGVVLQIMLPAS